MFNTEAFMFGIKNLQNYSIDLVVFITGHNKLVK